MIALFEELLGPPRAVWRRDAAGKELPFSLARFSYASIRNCACYATVGLSQFELRNRRSGRAIRQELMMLLREPHEALPHAILCTLGEEILAAKEAVLPGDLVGPRGPLWSGTVLSALFVGVPSSYVAEELNDFELPDGQRGVVAWLVPVTAAEASLARRVGRERFEEILVRQDPDVLASDRPEMALPRD